MIEPPEPTDQPDDAEGRTPSAGERHQSPGRHSEPAEHNEPAQDNEARHDNEPAQDSDAQGYAGPPPMTGPHPGPSSGPYGAPPPPAFSGPPPSGPYGPPPAGQYGSQAPGPYGPPPPYPGGGPGGPYGPVSYGQPVGAPVPYGSGPPPNPPRAGGAGLSRQLGTRLVRRPEARFGPSLAAAGVVLVAAGLAVLAIGYFAHGFGLDLGDENGPPTVHGEARRWLGAGLFLLLTAAGYALLVLFRRGPLATAGAVAAVIGVPFTLLFATIDVGGTFTGSSPVNPDVIFLVSIIAYLASYTLIPGARGRAVFLALAASDLYSYVAFKTAGTAVARIGAEVGTGAGLGSATSDASTVAALGVVFGLVYYGIAAALDRARRHGAAVAFVYAGFGATAGGLAAGVVGFGRAGDGVALILVGAVLAAYGGWAARRFTTWAWTGAIVLGVLLLVSEIGLDRYTSVGLILALVGLVVVGAGYAFGRATHERPDLEDDAAPEQAAAAVR